MYWTTGLYSITINGVPSFQAANPAGGVAQGTELTYPWFNDVQGELLNVVTGTAIVPAQNTPTQLLQGIKRIAGGNITSISATTVLTPDNAGIILVSAAAGNVVLTMPAVNVAGLIPLPFHILRTDTTSNTVTVVASGSDTFWPAGVGSGAISPMSELELLGDGTASWRIVGRDGLIGYETVSSSQLFTSIPGTNQTVFRGVGGGGGGGGAAATSSTQVAVGYAGSAGSAAEVRATSGFDGIEITIGAAGLGGIAGANAGGGGGTTIVGLATPMTCPGGAGGAGGAAEVYGSAGVFPNGGQTPLATGGDFNQSGGAGGPNWIFGTQTAMSGSGGNSLFGQGAPGVGSAGTAGTTALNPGAGGSGGYNGASGATGLAGGKGGAGQVRLWMYRS